MNIRILIALVISVVLIVLALRVVSPKSEAENGSTVAENVSIVDGKQIIDLTAKGGYSPRVIDAKAGTLTILRVTTKGTFDCSASLVIPKLSYQKLLQPSGVEEITIAVEQAQGTLRGTCSMGMYGFQIKFQ